MPEKVTELQPPSGLLLLAFKAPRWLYRIKLGWILGGRFLLLKHTGRVSGQARETVLEVVAHDSQTDIYNVAAAYGGKSDWYLNILKTPEVEITVGRRTLAVRAERVPGKDAGEVLLSYARAHPTAIKQLSRFMGYTVDGTDEDYRALGEVLHIIQFVPSSGSN